LNATRRERVDGSAAPLLFTVIVLIAALDVLVAKLPLPEYAAVVLLDTHVLPLASM